MKSGYIYLPTNYFQFHTKDFFELQQPFRWVLIFPS